MSDFVYKGFSVEHFSAESAFQWLGLQALVPDRMVGVYDDTLLPELPAALHLARDRYLADLQARAEANGRTFDNNLSYSLARIDVTRPQSGAALDRTTVYRLVFRPTDYFHFQFPNNALDEKIDVNGRATTARTELGLGAKHLSLERFQTAPCHFKLGTGTVVIAKPDKEGGPERVVVSIRSYRQLMVGRAQGASYHLSAAEGMLRPADGRRPRGSRAPDAVPYRGAVTPRGTRADPRAAIRRARTAVPRRVPRHQGAQPFVLMFVRVPLTFEQVRARWKEAEHKHENETVLGLPWIQETAHALCTGSFDDEDGDSYNVASNHAKLGFLMAAAHEDKLRGAEGRGRFLFRD